VIGAYTLPGYAAFYAVIVNLVLTVVLTLLFNLQGTPAVDETVAGEYHASS